LFFLNWEGVKKQKTALVGLWYITIKNVIRFSLTIIILRYIVIWLYWFWCYFYLEGLGLLGYEEKALDLLKWIRQTQISLTAQSSWVKEILENPVQDSLYSSTEKMYNMAVVGAENFCWMTGGFLFQGFYEWWIGFGIIGLYILKYGICLDFKSFIRV
jgi:hypothetical protein